MAETLQDDPALYDGVTLRHLAVGGCLDVLADLHQPRQPPRWTEAVAAEIALGVRLGNDDCLSVQEFAWLGVPVEPDMEDLAGIYRLQVALDHENKSKNAGEAQCIYFAERLGGIFVTDDSVAFDLAQRRLGSSRVTDTVGILTAAVQDALIDADEAARIVSDISSSGRFLRRGHPAYPGSTYFL